MTASEVAAGIRADAFRSTEVAVNPLSLAAAARVLAAGMAARLQQILKGKPWYWRLLFGRGLEFAVDILEEVARQITGDQSPTE